MTRLAIACILLSIIDLTTVALWLTASRRARRAVTDRDYWRNQYLEALKGKNEAATNARAATKLLVDRQNRVVEQQARIVEQGREISGLHRTIDVLCTAAGLTGAEMAGFLAADIPPSAGSADTVVLERAATVDVDATEVLAALDPTAISYVSDPDRR